jgi:hypothetical protein
MRTDAIEAAKNRFWEFGGEVTTLAKKLQDLKAIESFAGMGGDTNQLAAVREDIRLTTDMLQTYVDNYNEAAVIAGTPLIDPAVMQTGVVAFLDAAAAAELLAQKQQGAADTGKYLAEAERLVAESAGLMNGSISRAGAAVDSIRSKFVQAAAAGMSASLAFSEFSKFKGLEDQAKQIQSGLANLGFYDSEQIAFYVDLNTETALTSADEMIAAFEEMNTAAAGAAGGGVSQLESALSGLQGRALSAVQNATGLDIGLNPEDFLPREDAVNENARRLAAIMRDGLTDQPWLEEFKSEVPNLFNELVSSGDVQGSAARMLQDFQAGLRPELLDLGALKEQIKTQLAGEAAMQATAGRLAADLVADTGGDAADIQAKVNKALGLGVDSTAITDSIFGQLSGATFTSKVTNAASGAGKQWGETFLGMVGANVPAELVLLLTNLVTPQVRAQLLLEQSQTTPSGE